MSVIIKWAFRNKAAITLLTILILVLGVFSYESLPMELLPSADQPQVTVVVMGQGTDSKTMENQVTSPIEDALTGIKGKSNMYSTTGDGFSKIDLLFHSKTDMKEAKQEVQEALGTVNLPANVSKPSVVQLNTSMIPVSEVALTFKDGLSPQNMDFAKKKIVPYFKSIKGVASVQVAGTVSPFVSIKMDTKKMEQNHVSLQAVMGLLKGQNTAVAIGEKDIDHESSNLNVVGNVNSLDKIKNLSVGKKIKLKDIAKVEVKKPEDTLTRINGSDGLAIVVTKDSTSNAVTVNKDVVDTAKKITKKYKDAKASVVVSTADMVQSSVHSMVKEVLLGALFATIVIMLFLRNIRTTFITIVSIPLSLCLTLFLLARSGVTLNILTLGGVAVAVGRLVDDSIVVIENIFKKMQKGSFSVQLVIDASKEVGSAITASTLTTVAVFLPIGLVNGGLQDFMLPFALTITYSLLASLLVALTVVPLMSAGLLKKTKLPSHKPAVRFTRFITWSLNHKWVVILVSVLLFAGSIGAYAVMPKGAMDNSSADYVLAKLDYPNNTPIGKVKSESIQLEKYIQKLSGVKDVITQLGNTEDSAKYGEVSSPTQTNIMVMLKDKKKTDKIIKAIKTQKEQYPDADFSVGATGLMGGNNTQITVDVTGDSLSAIEKTAKEIKDKIKTVNGVDSVSTNEDSKKTVYSFVVNPAMGSPEQISQQLGAMLNRTPLGTIELNNQPSTVYLEPMLDPKSAADLKKIPVMGSKGMVPVSSVANLTKQEKPTSVFHKDGDTYVSVSATVNPDKLSDINAEIHKKIFGDTKTKGMKVPDGVKVYVGGASAQQMDDFTDLFTTMLVSIGLVFLIMVITFKSIRAPIAILCSLPLAAIGAILGLLISHITVEVTALLGALMLIGIVVTNAIVLLDRVKQNEQKMIIRDALVEAAATRTRPIFMTAVATICAMMPLLFKKAETGSLVSQSLAVVVIGGLAVATLLTLIVIPVVYELLHFKKSKKQRQQQEVPAKMGA